MKRRAKLSDRDPVLDVLRGSEPASQDDGKTVKRDASKAASRQTRKSTSKPARQDGGLASGQNASKPSRRDASKALKRQAGEAAIKSPSQEDGMTASQDDSKVISRNAGKAARQNDRKPASWDSGTTVRQDTGKMLSRQSTSAAGSREDSVSRLEPASWQGSKSAKSQDSSPGVLFEDYPEPEGAEAKRRKLERVKVTFYLEPKDLELLELAKLRRRMAGARRQGVADLSALVREAIRKAYGAE
jgi:hypothetical protein